MSVTERHQSEVGSFMSLRAPPDKRGRFAKGRGNFFGMRFLRYARNDKKEQERQLLKLGG